MSVTTGNILLRTFYLSEDVVSVARALLGKRLVTFFEGSITSGIISETEAYAGETDKASHAWNGRRTARTEIMYGIGGTAYVYLCYGVHSLFNVVTAGPDLPHAVLIRSVFPDEGLDTMAYRKKKAIVTLSDGTGPGNVSKLLGIHYSHSGMDICPESKASGIIWIEETGRVILPEHIHSSQRIGIEYAGEDALLPYRFRLDIP